MLRCPIVANDQGGGKGLNCDPIRMLPVFACGPYGDANSIGYPHWTTVSHPVSVPRPEQPTTGKPASWYAVILVYW